MSPLAAAPRGTSPLSVAQQPKWRHLLFTIAALATHNGQAKADPYIPCLRLRPVRMHAGCCTSGPRVVLGQAKWPVRARSKPKDVYRIGARARSIANPLLGERSIRPPFAFGPANRSLCPRHSLDRTPARYLLSATRESQKHANISHYRDRIHDPRWLPLGCNRYTKIPISPTRRTHASATAPFDAECLAASIGASGHAPIHLDLELTFSGRVYHG